MYMAGSVFDIDPMLTQKPALLLQTTYCTYRAIKKVEKMAALVHQMLAVIMLSFSSLTTVGNLQPAISPKSKFSLEFP